MLPAGKAASQPHSLASAEENSFSGVSSHAAPHKRSSRKSVGGSALRVLSANYQVGGSHASHSYVGIRPHTLQTCWDCVDFTN